MVAGETNVLETVTVTAEEYRKVMLKKDGVLDAMRSKLWWFRRGAGTPEAGKTLYYQHDGASPHTALVNQQHWSRHGAKQGFKIQVITQPAQSPDLNCNNLAFFASLQSDTELVAKKNVFDLVEAVKDSWTAYPAERMEAVWRVLYASFKGIMETSGDNSYSHHTGSRAAHKASARRGETHDRSFPIDKVHQAEKARDSLTDLIGRADKDIETSSENNSDEN